MAKRPKIRISPTGSVSTQVGPATVSGNPLTQSVGVSAPVIDRGDVGANVALSTSGFTPSIRIGSGPGAAQGASVGGTVGGLIGSAIGSAPGAAAGSAAGSIAGSVAMGGNSTQQGALASAALGDPTMGVLGGAIGDAFGGDSRASRETDARNGVVGGISSILGEGFVFPDGTTFSTDGSAHQFRYGDRAVNNPGRDLFHYETDYTNDMDYVSSMAGISLSRLLSGGTGKPIDQAGNLLGNSFLGNIGYGAEMNGKNFTRAMNNARAAYGKSGIQTKEDMLGLANKAYADGRINDSDYAVIKQTAGLVFDNNFGDAQALMAGRWEGLKTAMNGTNPSPASSTPRQGGGQRGVTNRYGVFMPYLSPEEALQSVKPYFDYLRENYPGAVQSGNVEKTLMQQGTEILGGAAALGGIYNTVNDISGGAIGDTVRGLYDDVIGAFSEEDLGNATEVPGAVNDALDMGDLGLDLTDFSLT